MLRGLLQAKKKRHNQKYENDERRKFTDKGKYTVYKAVSMTYKASGKVKRQSSKNIYIHTNQLRYTKQKDANMMSNIKYWWGERRYQKCMVVRMHLNLGDYQLKIREIINLKHHVVI